MTNPVLILVLQSAAVLFPHPPPGRTVSDSSAVAELEEAVARYRTIAAQGGWASLPEGVRIQRGDSDSAVLRLRARLSKEGYLIGFPTQGAETYDSALESSLRRFQQLHGLVPDGRVGPATIRALNRSAQRRADQLAANLERERARQVPPGDRYLIVNVPAFTLELVDGGHSLLVLRTIVGRADWPTPVFSSLVSELVFGPVWVIPHSIAVREILPLARSDTGYFARTRTRVFEPAVRGGTEVDPATVDWKRTSTRSFAYQFVQEPGPANPLGGVKVVFRSAFGVYLHDTPARALFSLPRRTLSHGCIRVEHIERLVAYLLPEWPLDSIRRRMREARNVSVAVPAPIPLQVVYRTAWVEADGLVAFRDDVYGLDEPHD